jgi:hypothetical protein
MGNGAEFYVRRGWRCKRTDRIPLPSHFRTVARSFFIASTVFATSPPLTYSMWMAMWTWAGACRPVFQIHMSKVSEFSRLSGKAMFSRGGELE